ncbi:hypothetical protein [Pleionea sediminis]|uniref:hypothetical protein n=1 Tax=Pleionea sediminis TaxID=2569479 RepID=UPI0011870D89|nr:hypothetical protein [Pleionea sediminis]
MVYLTGILTLVLGLLILIDYTDNSNGTGMWWMGKVLPPLGLLAFSFIPVDLITSIFWLLAAVVMLVSVISLFIKVFKWTIKCYRKRSIDFRYIAEEGVRPLLCIICFYTASHIVNLSVYSANEKALQLALEMKQYVHENGTCSVEKPVWANEHLSKGHSSFSMRYGEYGTQYQINYQCDPENDKFSYWVRISQDESFGIEGSFDGKMEVTYGDYGNPTTVTLDDSIDISALIKMNLDLEGRKL